MKKKAREQKEKSENPDPDIDTDSSPLAVAKKHARKSPRKSREQSLLS